MKEHLLIASIYLNPEEDAKGLVQAYGNNGADILLAFDNSTEDTAHEEAIGKLREICNVSEIPVWAAGHVRRLEDVKKLLYAGCAKVILDFSLPEGAGLLKEASQRFGREKLLVSISSAKEFAENQSLLEEYAEMLFCEDSLVGTIKNTAAMPVVARTQAQTLAALQEILEQPQVWGIAGNSIDSQRISLMEIKAHMQDRGIAMRVYGSQIPWSEFKLNDRGLLPVIVQDYQTDEVLMLAYMNEEAFENTLRTGRMTYWSRSRQELWIKGETSGHYQYVKSLRLDCDNDTLLAKVAQIGAACHTGNRSCFYRELMRKEYNDTNPFHVFQNVFDVILDRKAHPKEGSYTNYLFDKGIDKILKKVGEECTEIVIAAKNPDKEEIKYEISDFLYHMMVLMAEKGVTWEEITRELAQR